MILANSVVTTTALVSGIANSVGGEIPLGSEPVFSLGAGDVMLGTDDFDDFASMSARDTEYASNTPAFFFHSGQVDGWGTVGSGGSAPGANNLDGKGGAATTTVRANDTTEASAGTPLDMHSECWNIAVPWIYMPIPELRIRVDQADDLLSVSLITVPADSITVSGTIYWEEI